MRAKVVCGVTTQKGTPCQWDRSQCHVHQGRRVVRPTGPAVAHAVAEPALDESPPGKLREPATTPRPWMEGQDLGGLGWWLIHGVLEGEMEVARASVVSTVMRVLAQLGPAPVSEEEALREAAFRGRLMNGFQPHTEEEWAEVARYLDDEALAEMRRWPSLLESDRSDGEEPLVPWDRGADEIEVSVFRDDEDGR